MIEQLIVKYEDIINEIENQKSIYVVDGIPDIRKVNYETIKSEIVPYQEILTDLKELKGKVKEELYGQMLSKSEYKGACERLIGNNE